MDNLYRAAWAASALRQFNNIKTFMDRYPGLKPGKVNVGGLDMQNIETDITDLIADLLHLGAHLDLNVTKISIAATQHYWAEQLEETGHA